MERLVGMQIVSIEDEVITVESASGTKQHKLKISSNPSDCCGWASFEAKLFFEPGNQRNPVIVAVGQDHNDSNDGKVNKITFFGEGKPGKNTILATIDSAAGSGSGWPYGACVTITCKELGMNNLTLVEW